MALRLALFTDTFDETNGVAHTYRRLMGYAERSGLEVDIYAHSQQEGIEDRGSVRILRFTHRLGFEYYDQLKFSVLPNRSVFQAFENSAPYNLVHVAAPGSLGSWGRGLARRFSLPLVGVHHTNLHDYAALRCPRLLSGAVRSVSLEILRRFYRPCRSVLATTPKMAEWIRAKGINDRTEVFSRGVDCSRFSPERRTRGEGPVRLLYVGRLAVEKNLEALSRVATSLREHHAFELTLIGNGPLRPKLEAEMPWARFTGRLTGDDLAAEYANGDIFVFPSLTDTFGNVVLEAQASGLPCIVMDRSGPGEVILDGQTGILAPWEDEFAAAVRGLLLDGARRRQLGQNARRHALAQDWDAVFDRLWTSYDRLACEVR